MSKSIQPVDFYANKSKKLFLNPIINRKFDNHPSFVIYSNIILSECRKSLFTNVSLHVPREFL